MRHLTTLIVAPPDSEPEAKRINEPVTLGVPFPRGVLRQLDVLQLMNPDGDPVALQARALARWSDDSIQWALLDFQASVDAGISAYSLCVSSEPISRASDLTVVTSANEVVVDTGPAAFTIRRGDAFPFDTVTVGGEDVVRPGLSRFQVEDDAGRQLVMTIGQVVVEEHGPLRAAVLVTGQTGLHERFGELRCSARLHFFAGLATSRIELTVWNPRRARHRGGYWDLGDSGSFMLRDASIVLPLACHTEGMSVRHSAEIGSEFSRCSPPFELYQDSSGGANWRSSAHLNRDRVVAQQFRGYRLSSTTEERTGLRATPIVILDGCGRLVAAASRYFWQNFPKAMEATADALAVRLWPRQCRILHEIQGGEQKTHVIHLTFAPDAVDHTPLHWCRSPLMARADCAWYCGSAAVPYLVTQNDSADPLHRQILEEWLNGSSSFAHKREQVDEYGWRHFGDIYADHEAAFHRGPATLVSHYNNQYDAIAGFATQFMRTGDHRWWCQMTELAAHVCDIDIYHTTEDKAAYNGGMFWHTAHYIDADTSTHRTYPRAGHAGSGGPSAEHNYNTGLMLHHFLTGDMRSREAAIGLARWVIEMDDGRKTMFRWLASGNTGHASASGSEDYHGPGRGAANSIRALVDGHILSGDRLMIDKAEELIRRCINPNDSIDARNLLDAERRWFYTVFLQALGGYLDYKIEIGELDHMYGYARASLLAYVRWMSEHERLYLERPEILEFPNETWAAQEFRKSDVFLFGAKHAVDDERRLFIERSRFFFDYAMSTLAATPQHVRTRPTVLTLTNGFLYGYFLRHPEESAPLPAGSIHDYGQPERFVPQKAQARRRVLWAALGLAMLFAAFALT